MSQLLTDLPTIMDLSPLLRLPQEILIRVSSFVTTPELGNLRRTCKDVEARLFESFAHEFFRKRQFMIEEVSLQALLDISSHPTLSKRLTEVIISLIGFDQQVVTTDRDFNLLQRHEYADREILMDSGQARDMLAEAFSKLPNLQKIGLRDYDARGRYRDGNDAVWRSYGHSMMKGYGQSPDYPDKPFALVLQALACTPSAQVSSIEVFLRKHHKLSDLAFGGVSGCMLKTTAPVLAQLRTLMLTIGVNAYDSVTPLLGSSVSNSRLQKFLRHVPALEHLRLNFDGRTVKSSRLLEWLARTPSTSSISETVDYANLPLLTTLDLGMSSVSPATLLQLLNRFELKSFSLWKTTLSTKASADLKGNDNVAAKFMQKLAKGKMEHVERAMIGFMTACVDDGGFRRSELSDVHFIDKADDGSGKQRPREERNASFRDSYGAIFADWASDLAERTRISKNVDIYDDSDDNVEEDDDDEDDDDADIEADVDSEEEEEEEEEDAM